MRSNSPEAALTLEAPALHTGHLDGLGAKSHPLEVVAAESE